MTLTKSEMLALAEELYAAVTRTLLTQGKTISTMESCTAGLLASLLTDTEGSSSAVHACYVTYSNQAKTALGVEEAVLSEHGVYSPQCAQSMAQAARRNASSDVAVSVTGSFGNADPANADSIPGEVHFALCDEVRMETHFLRLPALSSRLEYKLFTAIRIGEELIRFLS